MENVGFIFTRHVNSQETGKYWMECYNCIRKFYPENEIFIIDDNSNYDFILEDDENLVMSNNCTIIKSEYFQRGEILSYYYFYKYRPFEKAIIIHDSVFLNSHFDCNAIREINSVKFLWHFDKERTKYDEMLQIISLFNHLKLKDHLWHFYNMREMWNGCFGVQSVITYQFLEMIETKYGLFELLNYVTNRSYRMSVERIFAVLCTIEKPELVNDSSLFGDIYTYTNMGYSFQDYLSSRGRDLPIIKVWTGR